jgi:hypothetical protein
MASNTKPDESEKEDRPLHEQVLPSYKSWNHEADIGARYLTSNKTVKIYVGPERKLWFLNQDLLCDRVPFFKGAFTSGFKEGKSKVMELPDDNAEAFGHLVDWVYKTRTRSKLCREAQGASDSLPHTYGPVHELQWLRLWVLADKLNPPGLAEHALKTPAACLSGCGMVISPEAVTLHASKPQRIRL